VLRTEVDKTVVVLTEELSLDEDFLWSPAATMEAKAAAAMIGVNFIVFEYELFWEDMIMRDFDVAGNHGFYTNSQKAVNKCCNAA
jgi:hypothetical protein